jgi:RimJ/RimL family protein N-acetyltransferase
MTPSPHPLWPLFDLRIRSERLVLRLASDADLIVLAALAKAGIHPPDEMPFAVPWSTLPTPQFETGFVQYHWLCRASWTPASWTLNLAVELDGELVGTQGIEAHDFAVVRTVSTGSWLGQAFQRRGIGTEMRSAVLGFAFDHLGAEFALTEANVGNAGSNGVSLALGYEPNGFGRLAPGGRVNDTVRYRMTRETWAARPRPAIAVDGLERSRALFGLE